MNELQSFISKSFGQVRGCIIDNIPYLVGKDVVSILGYSNISDTISKHVDEDDKILINSKTQSQIAIEFDYKQLGQRGGWLINESGFYSLVFGSELPTAKQFKHWVTSEVIPQIRKTGGYIPVTNQDDDLTIMARAHQILERTIAQKDQIIQQLKPKADTYDMIMDSDGTFSMNQVAKQVGMGEYHLFAYLRGKKVLFYEGTDNVPYERFRKNGCFKVIDTVSPDGKSQNEDVLQILLLCLPPHNRYSPSFPVYRRKTLFSRLSCHLHIHPYAHNNNKTRCCCAPRYGIRQAAAIPSALQSHPSRTESENSLPCCWTP